MLSHCANPGQQAQEGREKFRAFFFFGNQVQLSFASGLNFLEVVQLTWQVP